MMIILIIISIIVIVILRVIMIIMIITDVADFPEYDSVWDFLEIYYMFILCMRLLCIKIRDYILRLLL